MVFVSRSMAVGRLRVFLRRPVSENDRAEAGQIPQLLEARAGNASGKKRVWLARQRRRSALARLAFQLPQTPWGVSGARVPQRRVRAAYAATDDVRPSEWR